MLYKIYNIHYIYTGMPEGFEHSSVVDLWVYVYVEYTSDNLFDVSGKEGFNHHQYKVGSKFGR